MPWSLRLSNDLICIHHYKPFVKEPKHRLHIYVCDVLVHVSVADYGSVVGVECAYVFEFMFGLCVFSVGSNVFIKGR